MYNSRANGLRKTRPVGVKLFHADGQTDMTKQTVAIYIFANAPKKQGFMGKCTRSDDFRHNRMSQRCNLPEELRCLTTRTQPTVTVNLSVL